MASNSLQSTMAMRRWFTAVPLSLTGGDSWRSEMNYLMMQVMAFVGMRFLLVLNLLFLSRGEEGLHLSWVM